MLLQTIFTLIFLATLAYYKLYIVPKRKIQNFAKQAQKKGYKVKLIPFKFMDYYMGQFQKMDGGNLRVFKQDIGQYDLMVGHIFGNLAIIPINSSLLKDFYNQLYKLPKNPFISQVFLKYLNGGGIVFTEGDIWKRKRRIMSQVFHYDFLNDMIPVIQQQIQSYSKQIDVSIEKKQSVNLHIIFVKILTSVIAKCFFGTDMNQHVVEGRFFSDYFIQYLQEVNGFTISPQHAFLGMLAPKYGLTKRCRELNRKLKILHQISKQVTLKLIQKIKNKETVQKNLLTTLYQGELLSLDDNGTSNQYSIQQFIGQFFVFIGAGSDSSSHALNLMFHYLSEHKDIKQKILQQTLQVQKINDLKPTDRIKKLVWSQAVFNQTLRINGPISEIIPRISSQQLKLGEIQIPKGTSFNVLPIINHHKNEYFNNHNQFLPQRWLKDTKIQPYSFMPFAGGERNCIGQYLAKVEAKLIMSKLVKKYQFQSLHPIQMRKKFFFITEHSQFKMEHRKIQN